MQLNVKNLLITGGLLVSASMMCYALLCIERHDEAVQQTKLYQTLADGKQNEWKNLDDVQGVYVQKVTTNAPYAPYNSSW